LKIFSIIVTYNPDWLAVNQLVEQLYSSGVYSVIADNSDDHVECKTLNAQYCNLISLGENIGIASAQNRGLDYCLENYADIVVFFDQDSVISNDFISKLVEPIINQNENIVAPTFVDADKGFVYPIVSVSKFGFRTKIIPNVSSLPFHTNTAISSGTAVRASIFNIVGHMKDDLFIDYVDTEWCLRCQKSGFEVFILPNNQMIHSIGDKSFNLFGFTVPVHSPYRRYYRVRNSFEMMKMKHIPILLGLREVAFSLIHQLLLVITQKGRRKVYIKFALLGIWHGLKGIKGKLELREK